MEIPLYKSSSDLMARSIGVLYSDTPAILEPTSMFSITRNLFTVVIPAAPPYQMRASTKKTRNSRKSVTQSEVEPVFNSMAYIFLRHF